MTSADPTHGKGWHLFAAAVLYGTSLLNELLPVIFGTGEYAAWDWSFIHITLRWIVIPLTGIVLFVVFLLSSFRVPAKRVSFLLTAAMCLGLAVFQWMYPSPFFMRFAR